MESLNTFKFYQDLKSKNIKFLDYKSISILLNISNRNTLYKVAQNLIDKEVIINLYDGKFMINDKSITEFEIANYLCQPSYISLESALSYYGILPQFTYSITSITVKKTKKYKINDKEYSYSKIKQNLFPGYVKMNDFLIASKEKALLDSIYFKTKGIISFSVDDLDISTVSKNLIRNLSENYNNQVKLCLKEIFNVKRNFT